MITAACTYPLTADENERVKIRERARESERCTYVSVYVCGREREIDERRGKESDRSVDEGGGGLECEAERKLLRRESHADNSLYRARLRAVPGTRNVQLEKNGGRKERDGGRNERTRADGFWVREFSAVLSFRSLGLWKRKKERETERKFNNHTNNGIIRYPDVFSSKTKKNHLTD